MVNVEKGGDKKKTIFLVEDDLFLVKAYRIKLQQENFEIWEANDGKEAMKFLEKDPPDLVLLDLMLPGISGFDILAAIRKNDKWKDVKVIILTNLGQPTDIERGKKFGIIDYIIKADVKINDVIDRIKKVL